MTGYTIFNIGLTAFSFIFIAVQLWLCFKVKSLLIRLLPIILLSVTTAALLCICFVFENILSSGWEALGLLFLAGWTAFLIILCGICWLAWAITRASEKRSKE